MPRPRRRAWQPPQGCQRSCECSLAAPCGLGGLAAKSRHCSIGPRPPQRHTHRELRRSPPRCRATAQAAPGEARGRSSSRGVGARRVSLAATTAPPRSPDHRCPQSAPRAPDASRLAAAEPARAKTVPAEARGWWSGGAGSETLWQRGARKGLGGGRRRTSVRSSSPSSTALTAQHSATLRMLGSTARGAAGAPRPTPSPKAGPVLKPPATPA